MDNLIIKKFVILCMLVFGAWVAAISLNPSLAKAEGEPKSLKTEHKAYVDGEVIVKFKANLRGTQSLSLTKDNNLSLQAVIPLDHENVQLLKINSNENVNSVVTSLIDSGLVELAQPNYLYYSDVITTNEAINDAKFSALWGLNNTGQSILGEPGIEDVDLDAPEAWEYTNYLNEVIVAVIDTGVDINHPDLIGRTVQGWDFFHDDSSVYDEADGDYHGTHVAGTIAASADDIGVRGVANNVKIMPLKFIGPNGGNTLNAIAAIQYAKEHGAQVINASWGGAGGGDDALLNKAIEDSGLVFVASAGNDSSNNDVVHKSPSNLPASNIISVAAIDNKGQLAYFSNYGLENVDVGAPGLNILSTFPKFGQSDYSEAYAYLSGTSMAAPHVSGIAGVLLGQKHLTTAETIDLIKQSGVSLNSLQGRTSSGKMVNLYNGVATQVSKPSITLTSNKAGESSDYQLTFQLSSYGKLLKDDTIRLTFPPMSEWPAPIPSVTPTNVSAIEYSLKVNGISSFVSQRAILSLDAGTDPSPGAGTDPSPGAGSGDGSSPPGGGAGSGGGSYEPGGFSITFEVPYDMPGDSIVAIGIANIINPNAGSYAVSVSTSVDPQPINSDIYTITNNGLPVVPIVDFASTSKTATTASFSWTAAVLASSVTIQKSTDGTNWSVATTLTPILVNGASSATVTGLTAGTAYQFRLVVTGGTNAGESNVVSLTTLLSDPFSLMTAIALSNTSVELTFNKSVDLVTSQLIQNYSINSLSVINAVKQADPMKVILTTSAQNPGTVYTIIVNNLKDIGGAAIDLNNNARPFAGVAFLANPILKSAIVDTRKIILKYNQSLDSSSVPAPSDFEVLINNSSSSVKVESVSLNPLEVILTLDTPIAENQTLSLNYIHGVNPIKDMQGHNAADLSHHPIINVLGAPELVRADGITNTSVLLTFNEALDKVSAEKISNYTIDNGLVIVKAELQQDPTKVRLTTAHQTWGILYRITISKVKDTSGKEIRMDRNIANFAGGPADITAPAVPTGLSATPGDSSVTLNWNANTESDLAGYNVYVNGTIRNTSIITGNSFTVGSLSNGQQYSFRVSSVDASENESAKSDEITATPIAGQTPDPQPNPQPQPVPQTGTTGGPIPSGPVIPDKNPPAKPTGLTAQAGDSEVVLKWTANSEPDLASYSIYQNGSKLNTATVTGSTYTIKQLTNGTAYTFKISAKDTSGNESADSLEAIATPQLIFIANPAGLSYQLLSNQHVDSAVIAKAYEQLEAKKLHILTLLLSEAEMDTPIKLLVTDLYLLAKQMPDAVIEIKSEKISFLLPVKLIDYETLKGKLGNTAFTDLLLVVSMEQADQASTEKFTLALGDKGKLVSPVIKFTTSLEVNGKLEQLNDFNQKYVARTFELDEQANANELTVVTLDEATGQLVFVPAIFVTAEGITKVTLKSPHNSLYGVVRTPHKFADLSNSWAQKDIDILADKGLIKGVTAERFIPNAFITRAEFTVMLARALGLKEDKQAAIKLSDITEDSWYAGAVGAALKADIVSGYNNGTFGANEKITREQMAVMLGNALRYLQASVNIRERQDTLLSGVEDQQAISKWAAPSVAVLLETGIVKGRDDHFFAPQENASRAEAASMLVRFLQFSGFIN